MMPGNNYWVISGGNAPLLKGVKQIVGFSWVERHEASCEMVRNRNDTLTFVLYIPHTPSERRLTPILNRAFSCSSSNEMKPSQLSVTCAASEDNIVTFVSILSKQQPEGIPSSSYPTILSTFIQGLRGELKEITPTTVPKQDKFSNHMVNNGPIYGYDYANQKNSSYLLVKFCSEYISTLIHEHAKIVLAIARPESDHNHHNFQKLVNRISTPNQFLQVILLEYLRDTKAITTETYEQLINLIPSEAKDAERIHQFKLMLTKNQWVSVDSDFNHTTEEHPSNFQFKARDTQQKTAHWIHTDILAPISKIQIAHCANNPFTLYLEGNDRNLLNEIYQLCKNTLEKGNTLTISGNYSYSFNLQSNRDKAIFEIILDKIKYLLNPNVIQEINQCMSCDLKTIEDEEAPQGSLMQHLESYPGTYSGALASSLVNGSQGEELKFAEGVTLDEVNDCLAQYNHYSERLAEDDRFFAEQWLRRQPQSLRNKYRQ